MTHHIHIHKTIFYFVCVTYDDWLQTKENKGMVELDINFLCLFHLVFNVTSIKVA